MRETEATHYQAVSELNYGKARIAPPRDTYAQALDDCAAYARSHPGASKFIILYGDSTESLDLVWQELLAGTATIFTIPGDEIERRRIEMAPGSDHDTPYVYQLPQQAKVVNAWAVLLSRAQRGELGGPHDGQEETSTSAA